MTEAHWFSNVCPYFSVFDLERFLLEFGEDSPIDCRKLEKLEFFKCSAWLREFSGHWTVQQGVARLALEKESRDVFEIIYWGTPEFPESLKSLGFPPAILFCRGRKEILHRLSVAVVGARHPTEIGRMWVQKIIPELTKRGIIIVSGGARGIDAEAHWAALESGGETVAFLPGCVEKPYPKGNSFIFEKTIQSGCLVSEFAPGIEVRTQNFHRRNRLIAGLAQLVVIVEAAEKSGTLMTAGKALAENREILVVPGPPLVASYGGSLELISQGAPLARDAKDIILALAKRNVLKLKEETPTLW